METAAVTVFPEIEDRLIGVLEADGPDLERLQATVDALEEDVGEQVYSSLLFLLCHLRYPPAEAKEHWQRVVERTRDMRAKLGDEVDLRVALLDYFISLNRHFKNPKVIEIRVFQKTQSSAIRDELTGLYNHRYFRAELDREISRAQRSSESLSLVILDIDYFKWYNDRHGHLEGDRALQAIANTIREEVHEPDIAARYGGEEFAILLPDSNKPKAFRIAEKIRERVSRLPIRFAETQPSGRFTLSGGIAALRADADDAESLIEAADRALYLAKGRGKNQVISPGNEREFPRFELRVPGKLQRVSTQSEPFLTHNLSEQGLRLQCETPMQEGDFFHFGLMLPDGGREIEGLARTVRSRPRGPANVVQAEIVEISFENASALKTYLDSQDT